ncbi:MAG: hypothetical protein IH606_21115 [Burkholderiales bacterium]|nr:hypothetical protein [Burkholderiales bacterium]
MFALGAGMAQAKIPVAPMDDAAKAQAEEKKAKAAEGAKKAAELLAKAQDRVVERYKIEHGKGGKAAPEAKAAAPAAKK